MKSSSRKNTSSKAVRHGHSGNTKNYTVSTRYPQSEWQEMKESGIANPEKWTNLGMMTKSKADRIYAKRIELGLEAVQFWAWAR